MVRPDVYLFSELIGPIVGGTLDGILDFQHSTSVSVHGGVGVGGLGTVIHQNL